MAIKKKNIGRPKGTQKPVPQNSVNLLLLDAFNLMAEKFVSDEIRNIKEGDKLTFEILKIFGKEITLKLLVKK
jgi:hypothetical protein